MRVELHFYFQSSSGELPEETACGEKIKTGRYSRLSASYLPRRVTCGNGCREVAKGFAECDLHLSVYRIATGCPEGCFATNSDPPQQTLMGA